MTIFENVAFPLKEHMKLSNEEFLASEHKLRLFSLNPDEVNENTLPNSLVE